MSFVYFSHPASCATLLTIYWEPNTSRNHYCFFYTNSKLSKFCSYVKYSLLRNKHYVTVWWIKCLFLLGHWFGESVDVNTQSIFHLGAASTHHRSYSRQESLILAFIVLNWSPSLLSWGCCQVFVICEIRNPKWITFRYITPLLVLARRQNSVQPASLISVSIIREWRSR